MVITIADSQAFKPTSRATPAAPLLVSSVVANNTPATIAPMRTIESNAAASAKPLRLRRDDWQTKDLDRPARFTVIVPYS
jgi:hypothetical protein